MHCMKKTTTKKIAIGFHVDNKGYGMRDVEYYKRCGSRSPIYSETLDRVVVWLFGRLF